MSVRIAINGMGRIGRAFIHAFYSEQDKGNYQNYQIVAINDPYGVPVGQAAYLLKYDTVYFGANKPDLDVQPDIEKDQLIIRGQGIKYSTNTDISLEPLNTDTGANVLVDCTGKYYNGDLVQALESAVDLGSNNKLILLANPVIPSASKTVKAFVPDVNFNASTGSDITVSAGMADLQATAPILKILNENYNISSCLVNCITNYTNEQNLADTAISRNWIYGRGAAQNILPLPNAPLTKIFSLSNGMDILPELNDKVIGIKTKVPLLAGSYYTLAVNLNTPEADINTMANTLQNSVGGVIGCSEDPITPADILTSDLSVVPKANICKISDTFYNIPVYFDGERGFALRMLKILENEANLKGL